MFYARSGRSTPTGIVPYPRDLPSRCIKQNVLPLWPMISPPPHDICETPRPPSHTSAARFPPLPLTSNTLLFRSTQRSTASPPRGRGPPPLFTAYSGTAVSWSQRVPWILIRQTSGVSLILVHPFFNFIYVSLPGRRSSLYRVL